MSGFWEALGTENTVAVVDDSCNMQVMMYADTTNNVSFCCELAILQKGHSSEGRLSGIPDRPETTIRYKLQWEQVTGNRTDSGPFAV